MAWIISFNLGLVHLHTEQYCSAFHHFHARRGARGRATSILGARRGDPSQVAANFRKDYAPCFMYMGVALSAMNDTTNSIPAFEKSLKLQKDYLTHLNYAVALANLERWPDARKHFAEYERMCADMGPDADHEDGLFEMAAALKETLAGVSSDT